LAGTFKRYPAAMLDAIPSYLFGRMHEPANGLELFGPSSIALQAGFRSDGSLLYDPDTRSQAPMNNRDLSRLIAAVREGDGVRPGAAQLQALREIGELGRQRGLTLVGIQLPVIQGAVDVLDSDKDWNGYRAADRGTWKQLRSAEMRRNLHAMGINFFDLTGDPIAGESRAFIDPAHPTEYGIGMAFLHALNSDHELRQLFPRLDVTALQAALAEARKEGRFFDVYGAQF
jgi:hypothetical protein